MRARCYIQAYCAIGKLKSTKKSSLNNVDASRKLIDKRINIYLIVTIIQIHQTSQFWKQIHSVKFNP